VKDLEGWDSMVADWHIGWASRELPKLVEALEASLRDTCSVYDAPTMLAGATKLAESMQSSEDAVTEMCWGKTRS